MSPTSLYTGIGPQLRLHCVPIKVGVTGGRMYMGTGVLIFLSFRISKLPARDEGNGMILRQSRYWSPYIPASDSNPESGQFEVTSFDLCKWTQLYWRQVLAPHPPRIKMILGEEHIWSRSLNMSKSWHRGQPDCIRTVPHREGYLEYDPMIHR